MIVDFGNFLDSRIVDGFLESREFRVIRPDNQQELMDRLAGRSLGSLGRSDLILVLYYNFAQLPWLIPLIQEAEEGGIRVVNASRDLSLFSHPYFRSQELAKLGINLPNHYFGLPATIPEELGEMVVLKSLTSHLSVLCSRQGIHSLNEAVYVESFIPNPDQRILTVYQIAGCRYARWKEDSLQTKVKTRELLRDLSPFSYQLEVIDRIAEVFKLVFFNVEFIDRYVIDVNVIANFFYPDHLEPLEALADWLKKT